MPGARKTRNTRRENRLEELGRVDAEHAHTSEGKRNLRDEKYRIRSELKKGGKVKNGLSPAQSHYLQHGYGPHKRDRKAEGGKPHSTSEGREAATRRKVKRLFQRVNPNLDKIKRMGTPTPTPGPKAPGNTSRRREPAAFGGAIKAAKTMAAPGTHIRNVASGIKHGATKLIKGLPKIAKRGWK